MGFTHHPWQIIFHVNYFLKYIYITYSLTYLHHPYKTLTQNFHWEHLIISPGVTFSDVCCGFTFVGAFVLNNIRACFLWLLPYHLMLQCLCLKEFKLSTDGCYSAVKQFYWEVLIIFGPRDGSFMSWCHTCNVEWICRVIKYRSKEFFRPKGFNEGRTYQVKILIIHE